MGTLPVLPKGEVSHRHGAFASKLSVCKSSWSQPQNSNPALACSVHVALCHPKVAMKTLELGSRQKEIERVASLGQSSGEQIQMKPERSPLTSESCIQLLRELNSAFAAVLMNAQVLDGKLPSYSRSKRYIHEIERSAQRGGALLKRYLDRLPAHGSAPLDGECELLVVPPAAERTAMVASQGPNVATNRALDFAPSTVTHAAPDFSNGLNAHRRV